MNSIPKKWTVAVVTLLCLATGAYAQDDYSSYSEMTDRLQALESSHSDYVQLESLTETLGGKNVWLLTLSSGDPSAKPAIAVVGGSEGSHILGSELAVQFAEKLLNGTPGDSLESLLSRTTYYVVPRLNPDATEQYFADLRYERNANARDTDTDRDGPVNEDGYEDLNGDGLITMMRVSDRTGDWMPHSDDPRVMVEADASEGERGAWRIYSEGRDNDRDDAFNEDGAGGVDLNMNFTFDYPAFEPGAGAFMLTERENRALLDFLMEEAWNTYAVVSFGPANNLSEPISFNPGGISQRVIDGWYREDTELNAIASELYNEVTRLSGGENVSGDPGDFFQWAYFHYGRLSLSTPGWWTSGESGNDQADYLAWADGQNLDAFVPWTEISHPDFPNRTVEVGGIKPFMMHNPPYSAVDTLADKHTAFLAQLSTLQPSVEITNVEVEEAGENLTRVTVDLYNPGTLPTATRLGERTRWVRDVIAEISLGDGLSLVSGERLSNFESIGADASERLSWLVRGSGTFSLKAGAPNTGFTTIEQSINQ
ncbi:MAG: M14 family metallopeptidase [Balneolaceae bacterium]|nr:M14 family metallopeptidase [Balneolaceae bacterium]